MQIMDVKKFVVDPEHFERIAEGSSIHISVDGNKVVAVIKKDGKVIKRSEAKCSPEDEFNFETGAKIAFDRLFEKKPEFIPHLECTWLGKTTNYGEIGKPTNYKDSNGEPLFIGDTVNLKSGSTGICFSNIPVVEYKGHQFIMSISDCFAEDNSRIIKDDWTITKEKSHKDFKHNDKTICILTTFYYKLKEE